MPHPVNESVLEEKENKYENRYNPAISISALTWYALLRGVRGSLSKWPTIVLIKPVGTVWLPLLESN